MCAHGFDLLKAKQVHAQLVSCTYESYKMGPGYIYIR